MVSATCVILNFLRNSNVKLTNVKQNKKKQVEFILISYFISKCTNSTFQHIISVKILIRHFKFHCAKSFESMCFIFRVYHYSDSTHLKCSTATYGKWLIYWKAQV